MFSGAIWLSSIAFALFCAFDVLLSDATSIRTRTRLSWLAIILIPVFGGFAWFRDGRPHQAGATPGSVRAGTTPGVPAVATDGGARPLGPEDDPDFIRSLAERLRGDGNA